MFKKIEKAEEDGFIKTAIYFDPKLKKPYIVHTYNSAGDTTYTTCVRFAEEAYEAISVYEIKKQFSITEIADIKNYSAIQEKSNKELCEKLEIPYWGGKRDGAGRKTGSKSTKKKKYSKRTETFTKRITVEEKIFLLKCLEEFRSKSE